MASRWRLCEVLMTRWGPLITEFAKGAPAYTWDWSEYETCCINAEMIGLIAPGMLERALTLAHRTVIHPQNVIVGDRVGNMA